MSDQLHERMKRLASPKQAPADDGEPTQSPPAARPFASAPKPYPHRVTLDLTAEAFEGLRLWSHDERLTKAELLRGMLALCLAEPPLRAAVTLATRAHGGTEAQKH